MFVCCFEMIITLNLVIGFNVLSVAQRSAYEEPHNKREWEIVRGLGDGGGGSDKAVHGWTGFRE